jgi:hypothetical protein
MLDGPGRTPIVSLAGAVGGRHRDARTTKLYDRRNGEISLDEIERHPRGSHCPFERLRATINPSTSCQPMPFFSIRFSLSLFCCTNSLSEIPCKDYSFLEFEKSKGKT